MKIIVVMFISQINRDYGLINHYGLNRDQSNLALHDLTEITALCDLAGIAI